MKKFGIILSILMMTASVSKDIVTTPTIYAYRVVASEPALIAPIPTYSPEVVIEELEKDNYKKEDPIENHWSQPSVKYMCETKVSNCKSQEVINFYASVLPETDIFNSIIICEVEKETDCISDDIMHYTENEVLYYDKLGKEEPVIENLEPVDRRSIGFAYMLQNIQKITFDQLYFEKNGKTLSYDEWLILGYAEKKEIMGGDEAYADSIINADRKLSAAIDSSEDPARFRKELLGE